MKSLYYEIPVLMDRFDFNKVHRVMTFLGWTWAGSGEVPSIDELKATALEMLTGCVQRYEKDGCPPTGMVFATGGFQATVDVYASGDAQLELLFYVDSCHQMQDRG